MFNFLGFRDIFKSRVKDTNLKLLNSFFSPYYQQHNLARLCHLESLGLDLTNKKVLEFGAGVGDHTLYYLFKNCDILPTDGRPELVEFIRNRYGIRAEVFDAEKDLDELEKLGSFHIVHCYGILYHLSNPEKFIKAVSLIGRTLLMETCVSPDHCPIDVYRIEENQNDLTQAVSGVGCRPSRKWIENELKKYFEFVYYPKTQPDHSEFPLDWNNQPHGSLIRAIFIASQTEIINSNLTREMPMVYEKMKRYLQ